MEESRAGGLPLELSAFIGREREIAEIGPLIVAHRLVTLTGPGGAGKTRLAFEVAARLAPEFGEGVRVVELDALNNPALLVDAVAGSLGLFDRSGPVTLDRLAAYLEEREFLLILDNCEHLLDACAEFAQTLLRRCCADLRILATSREPLDIAGEVVWRVPPLATPPPAVDDPAQIDHFDAVRLFVQRATNILPAFTLTSENAAAVADICRRLDGMPLAIELAAARVTVFTPQQIAARLGAALDLLGGGRGAIPRHRTMRAAIDWSYRLLEEPAAAALRRFAVFRGSWELEAASKINDVSVVEMLPVLTQLIDKSLIVAEPESGEMRYRALETIRQYAEERLEESGEAEKIRDRHLAYYRSLAERATQALRSPRLLGMLRTLDRDGDNLRAALNYALGKAEESAAFAEQALRLANGLEMYWRIRSNFTEGRDWLAKALAAPGNQKPGPLRAAGLMRIGVLGPLANRAGRRNAASGGEPCRMGVAGITGQAGPRGVPLADWHGPLVRWNSNRSAPGARSGVDFLPRGRGQTWSGRHPMGTRYDMDCC